MASTSVVFCGWFSAARIAAAPATCGDCHRGAAELSVASEESREDFDPGRSHFDLGAEVAEPCEGAFSLIRPAVEVFESGDRDHIGMVPGDVFHGLAFVHRRDDMDNTRVDRPFQRNVNTSLKVVR